MRQIADRLEAERRGIDRSAAAEPVGAKAMVAISSNPETTRLLLRRASAIAGRLNTNWYAVYVRTKRDSPQRMDAREHRLLSENVTLAMELGAKVVWLSGEDVAQELLRFANEQGVTLAIFGKSRRPGPAAPSPQEPDRPVRERRHGHRRLRDRDPHALTAGPLPKSRPRHLLSAPSDGPMLIARNLWKSPARPCLG